MVLLEQVDIHRFEVVQQQQALLKVVGRAQLEADIIVPAEWMAWLKVGKKLQLQAEETQHTFYRRLLAILALVWIQPVKRCKYELL